MRRIHANLILLAAGALVAWASAPAAVADSIYINLTGLSLTFEGENIYDSDNPAGGNGLIGEATPLGSIIFELNSDVVEELSGDVYADIFIQDVPAIPSDTPDIMSSGGVFVDLLSAGGPLLQLQIDEMNVFFTSSVPWVAIIGCASEVTSQNLPGGLIIDPDDEISIFLQCDSFDSLDVDIDGNLVGFVMSAAAGTGEIIGTVVPEPGTLVLLLCLAAVALAARWFTRASR